MQFSNSLGSSSCSPPNPEGEYGSRSHMRSINSRRLLASAYRERPTPLSRENFESLLSLADKEPSGQELIDIATLVYLTGVRAGEVGRLRWKDIDFEDRSILITSSKSRSCRRVPFAGRVLAVLERRRERQPKCELVLGRFPQRTLKEAAQLLWTLSSRTRASPISMHVLRETFVWNWVQAGGNFAQLACIVGCAPLRGDLKSMASPHRLYAEAAKFQAQLEEPETGTVNPRSDSATQEAGSSASSSI